MLDQGSVGACTGFAAAHAVNTEPYRKKFRGIKTLRADNAYDIYSLATTLDRWRGSWPPTDTGSSGLAVAKALHQLGYIRSYRWAFGFEHGLAAILKTPLLQGTYWYSGMMRPDRDGRVRPTGSVAGGHEYLWIGIDYKKSRYYWQNKSWFLNSWSRNWGDRGYFYMTWDDHKKLLDKQGDLISLVV